jgi:mannose-6-phosphate isomerase-like protein (cupin superfamily)
MDIRQFILPAGVGLTHMKVYDDVGPDGIIGGAPHLHAVSSEIYFVISGTGSIELLDIDGLSTVELVPNKVVFFRPGVVHRVINPNRNLHLLSITQNGGLPERGDFVLTFPRELLSNPAAYNKAVRVTDYKEAIRRRDLAVEGFTPLREAFKKDPEKAREDLRQLYRYARNLLLPKVDSFEWVLKSGANTEVKTGLDECDFLRVGRTDYLERARHAAIYPMDEPVKHGMCGELHPYALDETFFAEGRKVA